MTIENSVVTRFAHTLNSLYEAIGKVPDSLFQLLARFAIAPVFWFSGANKVVDCNLLEVLTLRFLSDASECSISDFTFTLFEDDWALPFLNPELSAYMGTFAEHLLPVLLILGLASRPAAVGLLIMTLTIQFLIYPTWAVWWGTHILWVFPLLYIIVRGPGALSLDHLIQRQFK